MNTSSARRAGSALGDSAHAQSRRVASTGRPSGTGSVSGGRLAVCLILNSTLVRLGEVEVRVFEGALEGFGGGWVGGFAA
jgi:hypothetical protein